MANSAKKRIGSLVAAASLSLASFGGLAVSNTYAAPVASYTGSIDDAFSTSTTNRGLVEGLVNKVFDGVTDMVYTMANFTVDFVFQPTVLAVIVSLAVIALMVTAVVRRIKRRAHMG